MRVVDDHIDRLWKLREQATSFADIAAIEAAIAALSHAAGQDGEQCRAASGDREALATRLRELICEYWDLAYDEGVDKRNSDTPAGDANRVANEIETIIRALSRGVPEGDSSDPERYRILRDWFLRGGKLSEILPAGHVKRYSEAEFDAEIDRIRAIAAQRKEG